MSLSTSVLALALVGLAAAPGPKPGSRLFKGVPLPSLDAGQVDESRISALRAALRPSGDSERWTEIPWETRLSAARARAAREHKPLLMWVMDGHPLGCT